MIAAAALALAVGCDRGSDSPAERVREETNEAAARVKKEAHELIDTAKRKRAEWSADSEDRLEKLDRRLEELGARGSKAADHVGDETLGRLRNARREAREALDHARQSGSDAWETTKQASDEAIDRLEAAYRGATAVLRGDR